MLSDEEKKAIENLKGTYWYVGEEGLEENIKIVLNLIEKQSKEIEELKEIYQTGYVNGCVSKVYEINKKWKDKIKAKIEEIDIEIQCCEYADNDTEEYKQDIKKEKRRLLRDKAVLQSLLEKE